MQTSHRPMDGPASTPDGDGRGRSVPLQRRVPWPRRIRARTSSKDTRYSPIPRGIHPRGCLRGGDAAPIEVAPGDSINGLAMVLLDFGGASEGSDLRGGTQRLFQFQARRGATGIPEFGGEFARSRKSSLRTIADGFSGRRLTCAAYALRADSGRRYGSFDVRESRSLRLGGYPAGPA